MSPCGSRDFVIFTVMPLCQFGFIAWSSSWGLECSLQQRLGLEKKKQEVMERIREAAKEKCIGSIYKPEREALDWVMENKTERKNKGGVKKIKEADGWKRWKDEYKEELELPVDRDGERKRKGEERREEEYIYLEWHCNRKRKQNPPLQETVAPYHHATQSLQWVCCRGYMHLQTQQWSNQKHTIC